MRGSVKLWGGAVAAAVATWAAVTLWQRSRTADGEKTPPLPDKAETRATLKPMLEERMEDPVYVAAIDDLVQKRRSLAAQASVTRGRMEDLAAQAETRILAEKEAARAAARAAQDVSEEDSAERAVDEEPVAVDPQEIKEKLRETHPEWVALEAQLAEYNRGIAAIQAEAHTLVRERMREQHARRQEQRPHLAQRKPLREDMPTPKTLPRSVAQEIKDLTGEPVVVTNVPEGRRQRIPDVPDRQAVEWWPGKDQGVENPAK
jgi:hypothetical protein